MIGSFDAYSSSYSKIGKRPFQAFFNELNWGTFDFP